MRNQGLDARDYVSLAVRTDYDQINLRGKGFIYLAADSGPLKPNSNEMLDYPWAEGSGAFIYKILVHELGHVFGLQHQSNVFSFMAPGFPEALVKKSRDGGPISSGYSYYLASFFKYTQPRDFGICLNLDLQPLAVEFFGIPRTWKCYETRVISDSQMEVWGVSDPLNRQEELIGTATFGPQDAARYDLPVSVWLPDQQAVYPPNPNRHGRILYGAMIKHSAMKGVYRNKASGLERQISVELSPIVGWNKIGGVMDGRQYIDIPSNL